MSIDKVSQREIGFTGKLSEPIRQLKARFTLTDAYEQNGSLAFITVARMDAVSVITYMRDYLGFKHLVLATAVDIVERGILRIVYMLHNYDAVIDVGVQVELPRGKKPAQVPTQDLDAAQRPAQKPGHGGDLLLASGLESSAAKPKPAYTQMDSIHHLWAQAATYQREMKEMYGVDFPGSPRVNDEFVLEGWNDIPPMRRDFDTKEYSEKTFFARPGRKTHDAVEYMKQNMYPDPPKSTPKSGA